jgi:hypothetical protein
MGILEFHFHDCEFSPSMTVGDEAEARSATESATDTDEDLPGIDVEPSRDRSGTGKSGLGALLALAALVLLGALVKRKRGGNDDAEADRERPDVDVQE